MTPSSGYVYAFLTATSDTEDTGHWKHLTQHLRYVTALYNVS